MNRPDVPSMLKSVSTALAGDGSHPHAVAAQEWFALVEPMLLMGERTAPLLSDCDNPLLRQEMYRMMFSGMSTAYMGLFLGDPQHPDFWPMLNMANNFWAPNPDDVYYMAPVEDSGIYRVSGTRGTVLMVDFQIAGGDMLPHGTGKLGATFANYDLDKLQIEKDGSFEVILSAERPPGHSGNWWKLDAGATNIIIRQISYDWEHELDARFAIDRLDSAAIRPRMTAEKLNANLAVIATWAENWTKLSLQWASGYRAKGLINKVAVGGLGDAGGISTQKYIEGLFELGDDEALIYESEVPVSSRYWNIQLTDMSWSAIDYMNRQTSINGLNAVLDSDGKFRAVICATDPGVPNWLDTAGHTKGIFTGRWTECSSYPTPTVTRVKLADFRKYLPADTPAMTVEARDAAIRKRRRGAQLRRRW